MPELSTLLRQRLRATEDRSLRHPDADLLTAYVEDMLPAEERDQVLHHLSWCSECREVVALAMPDAAAQPAPQVAAAAAVAVAPRKRWFFTPAFGLAGSIAAVVLGVALILRLPQNTLSNNNTAQQAQKPGITLAPETAPQSVASNNQNQPVASEPAAANEPLAAKEPRVTAEPNKELLASVGSTSVSHLQARAQQSRPDAVLKSAPVFTDLRQQDYVNKTFLANGYTTATPSYRELPQAPAPIQSNMLFPPPSTVASSSFQSSGAFTVPSGSPASGQGIITIYSGPAPAKSLTLMGKIVDLGKHPLGRHVGPPISSSALGNSAMFKPETGVAQTSDAISAASGGHADAAGLAQSPAFTSNAIASLPRRQMLGVPQYQWKVVQGKLLRSSDLTHWTEENPAGENLQYSVVSHDGPEIWAGGAQAALVHSRDGGTTWETVTLGASATGTINSIEVAGQNLQVKSSSGQSWASQDGGKSWLLQD